MSDHLDITRRGERSFEQWQYELVTNHLKVHHVGKDRAVTTAILADQLAVDGRVIRAIVADADGIDLLIGGGDDGLYVAEVAEEARAFTRRLRGTASSLLQRAQRRDTWMHEHLYDRQPSLFPDTDE